MGEHGTGELGRQGIELGRCAGDGGGWVRGDVPGMGGKGGGDEDLWAGLKRTTQPP